MKNKFIIISYTLILLFFIFTFIKTGEVSLDSMWLASVVSFPLQLILLTIGLTLFFKKKVKLILLLPFVFFIIIAVYTGIQIKSGLIHF